MDKMKAFMSWSGEKSHEVAIAFEEWIPCVIQAVDPWVSSKDIDRGSIWFNEILIQLKDTNFGIVFLTKDNQDKPWLLFESGALSKGLTENRICTVLVDLNVKDIDSGSPFRHVNHTSLEKRSVLALVKTINKHLDSGQVPENRLEKSFNALWEDLNDKIKTILESLPTSKTPPKEDNDVLNDILENVLRIERKVSRPSHRSSGEHIQRHHADLLIKRLLKIDLDRDDIVEVAEDLIPESYLEEQMNNIFGQKTINIKSYNKASQ
jgi:hypothetical protein